MWFIKYRLLILLITTFNIPFFVESIRTKDKMYSPINGASCFRRLNATHTTGCSSGFGGSTGVLHLIEKLDDFDFIKNNPPAPPYAVIIPPYLFTRENILNLKESKFVSAIVLINNRTNLDNFSHEYKCPNKYSGLLDDQTCNENDVETTWNRYGTGLLYENYPFPMYYISNDDEISKLIECFNKFNNFDLINQAQRSLCTIEINSFMSAAVNSIVCVRRTNMIKNLTPVRYCDPLHGRNVYATLYPREIISSNAEREIDQKEKFIVISSRIDTTSLFDGYGDGVLDSLVSFVTLMSTAHTLSKLLPKDNTTGPSKNILFLVFNGESYDYIGSQRFVYDLNHKEFPSESSATNLIGFQNIELLIDIGNLDDINSISMYHQNYQENELLTLLNKYSQQYNLNVNIKDVLSRNLPPTSAQSFLKNNLTFPVVILNSRQTNKFYHSIYDDEQNVNFQYKNTTKDFTKLVKYNELINNNSINEFDINSIQIKIRNISTVLALSIFEMLNGSIYLNDEISSPVLIDELLYCYIKGSNCTLFRAASRTNNTYLSKTVPLRYVSVAGNYIPEYIGWAYRLFGLLIGEKIPDITEENCTIKPLSWFQDFNNTGGCYRTSANYTMAYSPAFIIEDYNWTSGQYSTWTESTWGELNARIFLKPSTTHEAFTLAIGFVVMILSFVLVFLINSRSDVLFGNCISSSDGAT